MSGLEKLLLAASIIGVVVYVVVKRKAAVTGPSAARVNLKIGPDGKVPGCPSGYEKEDCNHCCQGFGPPRACTKKGCLSCVPKGSNEAWCKVHPAPLKR